MDDVRRNRHRNDRRDACAGRQLALPRVRERNPAAQRDLEQAIVIARIHSHRRGRVAIRRQRGIVLFIALIVMVAMTLAAIALIRSVDTTNTAVGNLAFRQSSILPANYAVETAVASLFVEAYNGGPKVTDPTKDDTNVNYYSTFKRTDNKIGVPKDLQTYTA